VYEDIIHGDTRWDDIFFDGFACPKCNDGSHLDWTPQNIQRLNQSIEDSKQGKGTPLTDEWWAEIESSIENFEIDD